MNRQDATAHAPDVSVVILNWNTLGLVDNCLASLFCESDVVSFEAIVVDNESTDGSGAYLRRAWPQVRLIESATNVGFAAGNNLGFAQSRGRYVLILNSDTVVLPSTLPGLIRFLDAHEEAGCVGAQHLNSDGSLQRSVGDFPSLFEDFLAYTELHRLPQLQAFLHRRYSYWGDYDRVREVDWVNGACLMVRREVLFETAGFDDRYFIYAEELDLCYRIRRAGWRVYYTPDAQVVHLGGQAMNQVPDRRIVFKVTSQYRFYQKFYPTWKRAAWRLMLAAISLFRLAAIGSYAVLGSLVPSARREKVWEIITREPVVTSPAVLARAWFRLLRFATIARL